MVFVFCDAPDCPKCIGPLDTDPAPDHYRRVNLEAEGWVRVGNDYYCPEHAAEQDLTRQLRMFTQESDK